MTGPLYDDSNWPLYRISLPAKDLNDEEFASFLDALDGLFLRREMFGVVLDARRAPLLGAKRRQTVGKHAKASLERHPGLLTGFAVLLSSPMQRGVFTAIQWILRSVPPTRAFATLLEAEMWLVSQLLGAGVDPARLPGSKRVRG
jgi:hypothetical protein